jgi:Leucine-rich repeat (LRR) protein
MICLFQISVFKQGIKDFNALIEHMICLFQISVFKQGIKDFNALTELDLSDNNITALPAELVHSSLQ